jgi:glycosyltransferase involved in cell wall biosynthesis
VDTGVRLTFLVDSPTWGGAETYVASLLRRLPDRFSCTLVATEPVPAPLAATAEARGRLVAVAPVGGRWPRAPDLFRAVATSRPDLVHVNLVDPGANRVLLGVAGAVRAPAVATAHMIGGIGSGLGRIGLAVVYGRLAAVVAVSAEIRGLLTDRLGLPPGLVRVVRNGVEPLQPAPERRAGRVVGGRPPSPLVVGGVGRLTRQKGWDLLIEATRRLVREGWPVEVRLAGAGRERDRLAAAAAGLPVRLAGFTGDVPGFLAGLDVFCLPSRAEGLPLALLEAMMAGLPCLATAVGEVPAAAGEAALVVPPGDVDALTGALRRLLGDPRLRAELAGRARALAVRDFDVAAMVAATVAVYDEALAGRWGRRGRRGRGGPPRSAPRQPPHDGSAGFDQAVAGGTGGGQGDPVAVERLGVRHPDGGRLPSDGGHELAVGGGPRVPGRPHHPP